MSSVPSRTTVAETGSVETGSDYPTVVRPVTAPPGTREQRTARVVRLGCAVELLVGIWLAVSPWVVGSGGSNLLRWNNVVIGVTLAVIALVHLARPDLPRSPAVTFGLGAWTILAAFILSFQNGATGTAPLWNAIICAGVLTAAAAWSTTETERASLRQG